MAGPGVPAENSSGATNGTVPSAGSRPGRRAGWALPKSVSATRSPSSRTFAGLMSRCTTPAPCTARTASTTPRATRRTSFCAVSEPRSSRWASDSVNSSTAIQAGVSSSPDAVYIRATDGWSDNLQWITHSLPKRRRAASSSGAVQTFTAASAAVAWCRARYTTDALPTPIAASSR